MMRPVDGNLMDKKMYDRLTAEMTPTQRAFYDLLLRIDFKLGKLLDMDAEIAEMME